MVIEWWLVGIHGDQFGEFLVGGLNHFAKYYNYGKSPFLVGKSTISMAILHSYVNEYICYGYVVGGFNMLCFNHLEKYEFVNGFRMTSHIWNGQ